MKNLQNLIHIIQMKNTDAKNLKYLFSNLCCSKCKNDFDPNSFELVKKEGNIMIVRVICNKCGKDFGQVILHINNKETNHLPLNVVEGLDPITYDDVIEAHRFIKKL